MVYEASKLAATFLLTIYCRWEVVGRQNVPREGGVILASNHASYMDPVVVGTACPRVVHFMAKEELFRIPVFGGYLRALHAFPIRRESFARSAFLKATELIKSGKVVGVFPEGTRSADGKLLPAQPGVVRLALATGAPVVPVALKGTWKVLPRGAVLPRPAKIKVVFGRPLELGVRQPGRRLAGAELALAGERVMRAIQELME